MSAMNRGIERQRDESLANETIARLERENAELRAALRAAQQQGQILRAMPIVTPEEEHAPQEQGADKVKVVGNHNTKPAPAPPLRPSSPVKEEIRNESSPVYDQSDKKALTAEILAIEGQLDVQSDDIKRLTVEKVELEKMPTDYRALAREMENIHKRICVAETSIALLSDVPKDPGLRRVPFSGIPSD